MKKRFVLFFSILGLVGCSSLNSISVDQLAPSDVAYPSKIRSVGIVNNILPNIVYQVKDLEGMETHFCHVNGNQLVKQFSGYLADADYFDKVVLADEAVYDSLSVQPQPLSEDRAQQLMKDLDVDMLISFDQSFGTFYSNPQQAIPSSYLFGLGIATVETRLYLLDRNHAFHHFIDRDTLVWNNDLLLNDLNVKASIQDVVSVLPLKHLVPQWKEVRRFYYTGRNSRFRDAHVCLTENRWKEACELWLDEYKMSKGTARKEAAFNLSVGYELLDSIGVAKEWLSKVKTMELSKQHKNENGDVVNPSEMYYLIQYQEKCLSEKERQFIILKEQMSRFDDKK